MSLQNLRKRGLSYFEPRNAQWSVSDISRFEVFLAIMPEEEQDKILGPDWSVLWRLGAMTLSEMISQGIEWRPLGESQASVQTPEN